MNLKRPDSLPKREPSIQRYAFGGLPDRTAYKHSPKTIYLSLTIGLTALLCLMSQRVHALDHTEQKAKSAEQQAIDRAWELFNARKLEKAKDQAEPYKDLQDEIGVQAREVLDYCGVADKAGNKADSIKFHLRRKLYNDACLLIAELKGIIDPYPRLTWYQENILKWDTEARCAELDLCSQDAIQRDKREISKLLGQQECQQALQDLEELRAECPNDKEVEELHKRAKRCLECQSDVFQRQVQETRRLLVQRDCVLALQRFQELKNKCPNSEEVAKLEQEAASCRKNLGETYQEHCEEAEGQLRDGEFDNAINSARKAADVKPGDPRSADIVQRAQKAIRREREDLRTGINSFYHLDYSETEKRLSAFVAQKHTAARLALAYFYLGAAICTEYLRTGEQDEVKLKQALSHFAKAHELWGNDPPGWEIISGSMAEKVLAFYKLANKRNN